MTGALVESAEDVVANCVNDVKIPRYLPKKNDFTDLSPCSMQYDEDILGKARRIVYEKLSGTPTLVDDIIAQTGFSPNIVLVVLLELELAGRAQRQIGGKMALIYNDQIDKIG